LSDAQRLPDTHHPQNRRTYFVICASLA